MPTPYRKACTNCVRSKRRCDLALPQCHRCTVKHLECIYEGNASAEPHLLSTDPNQSTTRPGQQDVHSTRSKFITEPSSDPQSTTLFSQAELGSSSNDNDPTLPSFPDYSLDWIELMSNIDDFIVPDQLASNPSMENAMIAGDIYQARVVYAVKRIKRYPHQLVEKGQNAFISCKLYKNCPPTAIQDAICASALYCCRNETNQSLADHVLGRKAAQLIEAQKRAPSWLSLSEHLASVQALVIYQIIRLFDGDLRLRADAERDDPTLAAWTSELKVWALSLDRAGDKNSLEVLANLQATSDWQRWMFAESVRRTVIMSYLLQGMYRFVKNGWDNAHVDLQPLSYTGQGALWWAPSEHHWRMAKQNSKSLFISFQSWDADMAQAQATDLEELGVLIMVLVKGIDLCSEWLGQELLPRYGLDWQYSPS